MVTWAENNLSLMSEALTARSTEPLTVLVLALSLYLSYALALSLALPLSFSLSHHMQPHCFSLPYANMALMFAVLSSVPQHAAYGLHHIHHAQ